MIVDDYKTISHRFPHKSRIFILVLILYIYQLHFLTCLFSSPSWTYPRCIAAVIRLCHDDEAAHARVGEQI